MVVLSLFAACSTSQAQQAWIEWEEDLTYTGVSDDGQIIVGQGRAPSGWTEALRRTPDGAVQFLGELAPDKGSYGRGISGDGSTIVGSSRAAVLNTHARRAFRWTSASGMRDLGSLRTGFGESEANAISDDGKFIVGWSDVTAPVTTRRAIRWTSSGALQDLGPADLPTTSSYAYGVSADGQVVVGQCKMETSTPHSFRWTAQTGMVDLGTLDDRFGQSIANAVSGDGKVVVGRSAWSGGAMHAFRWTEEEGLVDISPTQGSEAFGVSYDGRVIVGDGLPDPYVWIDGIPHSLVDWLIELGLDEEEVEDLGEVVACSRDGRILIGRSTRASCRIGIPLPNRPPSIASPTIDAGDTITVPLGESFLADFLGTDPDGEALTLSAVGLPPSVSFEPALGSSRPSPFDVTLDFTPGGADVGTHDVVVSFKDEQGDAAELDFTIVVPPNNVPTLSAPSAHVFECSGEHNLITLNAAVDDADDHRLTVRWYVEGVLEKTATNVVPGTNAQFQYDFPHGVSDVEVRVTDGYSPAVVQAATVTVQDTTDPMIVVAPTQIVPTDPGLDYATKVRLPKPQINEACDGDPVLTSDAPDTLPIGEYQVIWTVRDFTGNASTATQTIVVKDLEGPQLQAGRDVRTFCDRGQPFATVDLSTPTAVDNVSDSVEIAGNERPRYRIGTTVITWTATDEEGNVGTATQKVIVVNRKPKANAGANVVVTTRSEQGARVRLNGSGSSDPDGHSLKYRWSARGATLSNAKSKAPQGTFKVGKTTVKLTVTDEGGATHTDSMTVTVRLKGGSGRRSQGVAANEAFSVAAASAERGAREGSLDAGLMRGNRDAQVAVGFGVSAGEFVRWEEGESEADAFADYAELRYFQALYGSSAASALLQSFAETGDAHALTAAIEAARGVQAAQADLQER